MRTTGKQSFQAISLSATTFLVALLALTLLLLLPNSAAAQTDAARILAGRVLDNARFPSGSRNDRDGGIWRDDDRRRDDDRYEDRRIDNRRDAQRLRREQKAREKFCRKNPRERVCRVGYGYGYGLDKGRNNNAAWCWDRNRDARCDVSQANRRPPGRRVAWGRR